MISTLKKFLKSLGINPLNSHPSPFSYNYNDYILDQPAVLEKIIEHRNFLKSVLEDENNRLGFIENKTSQIISQTSIVFSLLSLFVPIIMDRFEDVSIHLKLAIILLLLLTFSLYLLSITNALKNFNIKKFKYPYSNPANVLDFKDKSLEEFNSELVRDYLYCINKSVQINNEKATNLLHSYKAFKIGNFLAGILTMFICSMLLFTSNVDSSIKTKPAGIKTSDSISQKDKPTVLIRQDTIRKLVSPKK